MANYADYTGADSLQYAVIDHVMTAQATVSLTIRPAVFSWTQSPAASPVLSNPGSQASTEGESVSLAIQASDPNNDALTYAAVNLPVGLSIDPDSGVISGTVDSAAAEDFGGSYATTVIVADSEGGSTSVSFTWTVSPFALTAIDDQDNLDGDAVALAVTTGDQGGGTVSYNAVGLPPGLTMDAATGRSAARSPSE